MIPKIILLALITISCSALEPPKEEFGHFFGDNVKKSHPDCLGLAQKILKVFKPNNRHEISTRFFLTTKENLRSGERQEIHVRPRINLGRSFKTNRKVGVICHGYQSNADQVWVRSMEKALVEKEGYNVISVDWRLGANKWNYIQAASNTRIVGAELASLVQHMIVKLNISATNFHLIGHSLGAHVVSYVSNHTSGTIGRITGLDPANPCFSPKEMSLKLGKEDADFVDVIHTNGRFTRYSLGQQYPIGHIDFYPNGGQEQPGCRIPHHVSLWKKLRAVGLDVIEKVWNDFKEPVCSHSKAAKYFTESINGRCTFWGHKWDIYHGRTPMNLDCTPNSCAPMGMKSNTYKGSNGSTFYVFVRDQPPFCLREPENDAKMSLSHDASGWIQSEKTSAPPKRNAASAMFLDFDIFFFGVIILVHNVFNMIPPFVLVTLFLIILDKFRWHNWKIRLFERFEDEDDG